MSGIEQEINRKSAGLTLGDAGLGIGLILGIGNSLTSNDIDTGNYITDIVRNFCDRDYLVVVGCTTFGYVSGRIIDFCRKMKN